MLENGLLKRKLKVTNKSVYFIFVVFLSVMVVFTSIKKIELRDKLRKEQYNF
jgi:hypothetical protein